MPALVIPNTFEIAVYGDTFGNEVVNVFHYLRTGGINASECATAAISFRDNNLPSYLACLSSNYHALKIVVKNLHTAGGPVYELPLIGPYPGMRPGNVAPGNVAVAVSWRTSSATRSGRGRTFMGPLSDSDIVGDIINATLASLLAAFGNAMVTQIPVIGAAFAVASRKFSLSRAIASFVLDSLLDSMRRRLTGRGR